MGQAATLPCRKEESYVTKLYEWFSSDLSVLSTLNCFPLTDLVSHRNELKQWMEHSLSKQSKQDYKVASGKFINECPSGLITLHEFRRHFCNGTVGNESAEYAEQIFRTLDNNGDGVVDFREYVMAISMLIEGSSVEKLRWSFKLYDKDSDGAITREEMLEIMQAVYKMTVAAAFTKLNPLTAEECTNRIFMRLDKDNNAVISLEEFIEGALDDEWIREMLECDPNTVKVERPLKRD